MIEAIVNKSAVISDCGLYRYLLTRIWNADVMDPRMLCWIMLNPSTADGEQDDPTIRKCIGFAKRWDYDGIFVVNLFAFRATSPKDMKRARDPVGPLNDAVIADAVSKHDAVAAWGNDGKFRSRGAVVRQMLREFSLTCLGLTGMKQPNHPLYVPYEVERMELS